MKAEIGVTWKQTKEHVKVPDDGKGKKGFSLQRASKKIVGSDIDCPFILLIFFFPDMF